MGRALEERGGIRTNTRLCDVRISSKSLFAAAGLPSLSNRSVKLLQQETLIKRTNATALDRGHNFWEHGLRLQSHVTLLLPFLSDSHGFVQAGQILFVFQIKLSFDSFDSWICRRNNAYFANIRCFTSHLIVTGKCQREFQHLDLEFEMWRPSGETFFAQFVFRTLW